MDFVEKLPMSDGADTVLVVIDRLSKYGHFIPLSHPFTAEKVASLFLDNIFKLHGLPDTIVCDRDKIFTSIFWKTMFEKLGVTLNFTSAYHPQSDGQTERLNQCLEAYLRCFSGDRPASWKNWLSMAEYWYNTAFHASLGITPYEALYGTKHVPLNLGTLQDMIIPAAQDLLIQRENVMKQLQENLVKAQQRMKYYADQKRTEREFKQGDWVFLKLQPYRQHSVVGRISFKLAAKFFGPFQVEERIGEVAYKLKLPSHSRIHPVFHVSLLKKFVGNTPITAGELPDYDQEEVLVLVPEKVLQRRQIERGGKNINQWLVKWKDLDNSEASWEDCTFIKLQFPQFKA